MTLHTLLACEPRRPWRGVPVASCCLALAGFCLSFAGSAPAQSFEWDRGSATDPEIWSVGENWVDDTPPAPDQTGDVLLPSVSGNVNYDLVLDRNQTIRGDFTYTNRISTFDLGGFNLTIDDGLYTQGAFRSNHQWTNGALVFGIASGEGLAMQFYTVAMDNPGTIEFRDTATVHFANVISFEISNISGNATSRGTVDLREAILVNSDFAVANQMILGQYSGQNSNRGSIVALRLPASLSELHVGTQFIAGRNLRAAGGAELPAFATSLLDFDGATETTMIVGTDFILGQGDNASGEFQNLPDTFHLTVGSPGERGVGFIAYNDRQQGDAGNNPTTASIVSNGGTLELYFSEWRVGQNTIDTGDPLTSGSAVGTFDFSAADLNVLDISGDAFIGVGVNAEGDVRLSGGDATSQNLTLGDAAIGSSGRLDLNGTVWTIQDTLTIGATGRANLELGLTSAGFDLTSDEAFKFDIATGGVIDASFEELVQVWAVRMLGDQTALFEQYVGDGRLLASGTYGSYAEVFFDGTHTTFGIIPEPGSALLTLLALTGLLFGNRRRHRSPKRTI